MDLEFDKRNIGPFQHGDKTFMFSSDLFPHKVNGKTAPLMIPVPKYCGINT